MLSPAPPPPERADGKPKDVSFDREKTMMRLLLTEGYGHEVREGAHVTVHWSASVPADDGALAEVFSTEAKHPRGVRFVVGRTLHCEAVERALIGLKPGSVLHCFCTDMDAASCPELGFTPRRLVEGARKVWESPGGPIGVLQGALEPPGMIAPKPEDTPPRWQPPRSVTQFHIKLDAATDGPVPMLMDPHERLQWCHEAKQWGSELFRRGLYARAMRRYKKTMLDLEIPCQWSEQQNIERNHLRLQAHLNIAACGLKIPPRPWSHPNLSPPKTYWDPLHDAIFHCTRVLAVDPANVKAYFRRAQAHLQKPPSEHINGLQLAKEDLKKALELDPKNVEVRKLYAKAKELQREADAKAASVMTKMFQAGDLI
ncbi:hypothetical protein AB1Y20_018288 [Prymnesium parvum]|uniref:Peptidylprolyl isomerase n=1 Tax=Prymnesium parvum TaxID=97485 RepID=A0AB34JRB3_PRYPA